METLRNILKKLGVDTSDFSTRGLITVVGVFFLGFGVLASANLARGQLTVPLADHFGVERSVISLSGSTAKIAGSIAAILYGKVYKTLRLKGTVLMAGLTFVIQYLMVAFAPNPTVAIIGFTIAGFGAAFAGGTMIVTIIRPWFPKNLGLFAAICGTASGFGGQFLTPLMAKTIAAQGFKPACLMFAGISAACAIICALLVSQSPNDPMLAGNAPKAAEKKAAAPKGPTLTYGDYLKEPTTYLLFALMFVAAGTHQTLVNCYTGIAQQLGFEDYIVVGGSAAAGMAAVLVWAKFIMGWLKDKGWTTFGILFAYGTNILAIVGMMFFSKTPDAFVFFASINAFSATATGLFINLCVAQAFGKYATATAYGITLFGFNIGRALGEPLMQLPYDLWGSYNVSMWIGIVSGIFMMFGLLLACKLGGQAEKRLDAKFGAVAAE